MIRIVDNSKDRQVIRNLISNTSTCARGNKVRLNMVDTGSQIFSDPLMLLQISKD